MKNQSGFSMVQLMIASMLGLLLSAAVLSSVFAAIRSHQLKRSTETIQENASLAIHFITKDMAGIGFVSCFDRPMAQVNNLSKGKVGRQLSDFSHLQGAENQYRQSDAVSFISVLDAGTELSGDMATVHAQLDLVANNNISQHQEMLVTNCVNADLFKVSSIWNNRLSHDDLNNVDANLSTTYLKGSLLYPLSLVSYKLARGAGGQVGLFRKINRGNFQELIPNVAQFRLEYGIYDQASRSLAYVSANAVDNAAAVVSIRVYLLLASSTQVLSTKMFYQSFSGAAVQAADLSFYKAYQFVIALRNRKHVLG